MLFSERKPCFLSILGGGLLPTQSLLQPGEFPLSSAVGLGSRNLVAVSARGDNRDKVDETEVDASGSAAGLWFLYRSFDGEAQLVFTAGK